MSVPHKHAELMLEYAKDAAKTNEPWKLWQVLLNDATEWSSVSTHPVWVLSCEYRRKPVKWEPEGGDWWITSNNDIVSATVSINCEQATLFGTRRPTKEQAERAAVEMRKFNRLLALRDELCGDDENYDRWLHTLAFKVTAGKWEAITVYDYKVNTVLFTTGESAQRACDMLNSGEVEL